MVTINELLDLSKTIAADLFEGKTYPWEVLDEIKDFILKLGETLPADEYAHPADGIWIANDAKVFPSAYIGAPCIIDHGAEIRHCAFIRGSAIVGKNAVVGNSCELKNVVLFDQQRQERQDPCRGEAAGCVHRDRAQKVRRDPGRLCRGGLQQRAESGNRGRPLQQHLPDLLCARRNPRQQHLQGQGRHRPETVKRIHGRNRIRIQPA